MPPVLLAPAAKPSRRRAAGNWTDDGDGLGKVAETSTRAVSRTDAVEEEVEEEQKSSR
jgi:hypothetical protein